MVYHSLHKNRCVIACLANLVLHNRVGKIANIVHCVVVFLDDRISGCFIVPTIQSEFGYAVNAGTVDFDVSIFQVNRRSADTIRHIVVRLAYSKTTLSLCGDK